MKKIITFFSLLAIFPTLVNAQLVFTEVMYNPTGSDAGQEWVEIYNQGAEPISLDGQWKFFDGSSHNLTVTQGTATIAGQALAIITDKPDLFLTKYPLYDGILFDSVVGIGNSGSTIALYHNGQPTADSTFTFDPSWGGSGTNKTLEKIDPAGTNDRANWRESLVDLGTPGSLPDPNPDPDPVPDPNPVPSPIDLNGKLIITELLPNPVGIDTASEWIELFNTSDETVSLAGVTVQDSSTSLYRFVSTDSLGAHQYLVLGRTVSDIALNNDQDRVIIKDNAGRELDRVDYTDVTEGSSYARIDDQWTWTSQPTPGADNVIPVNQAPVISYTLSSAPYQIGSSIAFDASSSRDPEGESLTYAWDFTDGTTSNRKTTSHTFKTSGIFNISLRVMDKSGKVSEQVIRIEIAAKDSAKVSSLTQPQKTAVAEATTTVETLALIVDTIRLSEFVPNPVGSDAAEWIELYNTGETEVNISGWLLDDEEGGSKPFHFPANSKIGSKQYQVWSKMATKLALNNDSDKVRLLDPQGLVLDAVEYSGGKEGQSYIKDFDSEEWQWQAEPTPGLAQVKILGLATEAASDSATTSTSAESITSNQTTGLVLVAPGLWARQKFYLLTDPSAEGAVTEVYNYRGDFPSLKSGDVISVTNYESSINSGLTRLKISTPSDIQIISHDQIPTPDSLSLTDITADLVHHLVAVQGIVQKVNKQTLILQDDDANSLSVYLGPDWKWGTYTPKKEDTIIVRGIIQKSGQTLRLRPMTTDDISLSTNIDSELSTTTSTATSTIHQLGVASAISNNFIWWLVAGLGIIIVAGAMIYKWWFVGHKIRI